MIILLVGVENEELGLVYHLFSFIYQSFIRHIEGILSLEESHVIQCVYTRS